MGLKVDSTFLKYVTMGAVGTRRVGELMEARGLQPIELERYSRSNKIWTTKIKRLRLPDLLCVRTGQRVEVRAKSKLAVRMSDAPNNPERRWNSGLRRKDIIAFIHVREEGETIIPASNAELFRMEDLLSSEGQSVLGKTKSAGEGAERDREWPSIVASDQGTVIDDTGGKVRVQLDRGRHQTYQLKGKSLYIRVGGRFRGATEFLAGTPQRKAAFLPNPESQPWEPRTLLNSDLQVDRYVAVKALGVIGSRLDFDVLADIAKNDSEPRVALEAAASLARLGNHQGLDQLQAIIEDPPVDYLRMEAVLVISELYKSPLLASCAQLLLECASSKSLAGDEVRQAAIWGLGRDGLAEYEKLVPFLDAEADEERVHAVCAFVPDVSPKVVNSLIAVLTDQDAANRARATASYLLSQTVLPSLAVPALSRALKSAQRSEREWIIATLGQADADYLVDNEIDSLTRDQLKLLQLMSPRTNWTRSEKLAGMLSFVNKVLLRDFATNCKIRFTDHRASSKIVLSPKTLDRVLSHFP